MATKNFRSTVLEPTSEFAHGDKLRFTALATVGEVLKGSFSETTIGEDGVYSVDLQYGKHRIDYKPYEGVWRHFADVEVNADTLATTLQDLALASVPVTDETVLVLQGILADAEAAKTAAEAAAKSSEDASALAESALESAVKSDDLGNVTIGKMLTFGDRVDNLASLRSSGNALDWILIKTKIPFGKLATTVCLELSCRGAAQLSYHASHTMRITNYYHEGSVYGANAYTDSNYQIPDGKNKFVIIDDGGFYSYAIASGQIFTITVSLLRSPMVDVSVSEQQGWTIEKITDEQLAAMSIEHEGLISQLSYQSAASTSIVSSIEHNGVMLYSVDSAQAKEIGIPDAAFNAALSEQQNADLFESEKSIALQILADFNLGTGEHEITGSDISDVRAYIQSIDPAKGLKAGHLQRAKIPRPSIFDRYS